MSDTRDSSDDEGVIRDGGCCANGAGLPRSVRKGGKVRNHVILEEQIGYNTGRKIFAG